MTRKVLNPHATYPWTRRRIIIGWVVLGCSLGLAYLTLAGADTRLNETLALGFFGLLGATVGSYVFGAVWHDRGLMEALAKSGRSPIPEDEQVEEPKEG